MKFDTTFTSVFLLQLRAFSGEGSYPLGGCPMMDGTIANAMIFMTPVHGEMGDDISWFGCMEAVFQRAKQVGVF